MINVFRLDNHDHRGLLSVRYKKESISQSHPYLESCSCKSSSLKNAYFRISASILKMKLVSELLHFNVLSTAPGHPRT